MKVLIGKRNKKSVQSLLAKAEENSKVDELHFWGLEFDEAFASTVLEFLESSTKHWRCLELDKCTGVDHVVTTILSSLRVDKIVVNGGHLVDYAPGEASDESIIKSHLQSVSFRSITWTSTNVGYLQQALANPKLESLDLQSCSIDNQEVVRSIANSLENSQTLRNINISKCQLSNEAMATLLQALTNHSNLTELDLSENQCHGQALSVLCHLLESSISLKKLHVNNVCSNDEEATPLDITKASSALERNNSLAFLSLGHNRITSSDAMVLAKSLVYNTTLKTLHLNHNGIDDDAIPSIVSLWDQWSMHTLWLFGNALTVQGSQRLAAAFSTQTKLCALELDKLGPQRQALAESQRQINHWGELNWGGRSLLRDETLPLGAWATALARANSLEKKQQNHQTSKLEQLARCQSSATVLAPNILYHLLHGPALLQGR